MAPAPPVMTVGDYFTKTPYTAKPMELIYGALRVAESPTPRHQSIVAELFRALDAHVRANALGRMWLAPLDVVLDPDRALIVQPDLFFVSTHRSFIVGDRIWGAPDLMIEVLSPEPRIGRLDERIRWFAEYRVRECWLVRQNELRMEIVEFADGRITARRRLDQREPIVSTVLSDLRGTLGDILSESAAC